jgi:hypothetical protein
MAAANRKLYTLLLILTAGTFFVHVPHTGSIGFLLNSSVHLSYKQYFWVLCQHLNLISLSAIVVDESITYKTPLKVFLWLHIIDLMGFVLSYDDPLKNYVVTFNVLKLAIFLLAIVIDKWNHSKRELSSLS